MKDHLRKALREGRVPHSLIFTGPAGVGKRQFALQLAKSFVCGTLSQHQGCGECAACARVEQLSIPESSERFRDSFKRVFFSSHPDVASVVPYNRAIFVDAVRDLEREAFFRPYEARARFFVIDEADKMNDAAANALLKTLEEPSETSYIVLVTSRPDSLLSTIRSRCQIVRFAPVERDEVREHLVSRKVFTDADAQLAACLSGGSIGRALLFDIERYKAMRDHALAIIEKATTHRDIAGLLKEAEVLNDAKHKEDFEEMLGVIESLLRDVWLIALGVPAERAKNLDIADELSTLAAAADPRQLAAMMKEIDILRQNLVVNINRKMATDALLTQAFA